MADPTDRIFWTPKNQIPVYPLDKRYGDAFDSILPFTLAYETGGDVTGGAPHTRAGDSGGLTKFGIAQNYNPEVDVASLTQSAAIKHLRRKYWEDFNIGDIADPLVQAAVFDMTMNTPRGAADVAQRIVQDTGEELFGSFPLDGQMGPRTIAAINKYIAVNGPENFVAEFNEGRRSRARKVTKRKFRKGIINRVDDLEAYMVSRPFPGRNQEGYDRAFARYLIESPSGTFSDLTIEDFGFQPIAREGSKLHQKPEIVPNYPARMHPTRGGMPMAAAMPPQAMSPQAAGMPQQGAADPRMQILQAIAADPVLLQMVMEFIGQAQQQAMAQRQAGANQALFG